MKSALLLYKSALDGLALSHSSRMISSSSQSSGTPTTATSSGSSVKAISPSSSTSSLYSAASSAGVQECDDASTNAMKPSPLRIRKVVRFVEQESTDENCRQGESRSSSSSFTAASTDTWLYFNAISRYNTNLAELGIQLGAHIGAVDQLIAEARADKESKLMERSNKFAELRDLGYYEDEIKQTSKLERIELGRATSWKRRRFEPGRYQELCQRALQEL
ncbi:MAG: hypothetical protein M1814_000644 [Vezdaea aestivalis]|nr:MAG: hypothetical protein M1814_000644 [Vezdaea aestivalis]